MVQKIFIKYIDSNHPYCINFRMKTRRDLSGIQFADWTVLHHHEQRGYNHIWWCRCVCGKESAVQGSNLGRSSTSCGCEGRKRTVESRRTHGKARTKTYITWKAIKTRCKNPNNPAYPDYGGRGISICKEWDSSFDSFLHDMGERPNGMTIERKNNNLGYSPDNCIWADRKTQSRNRRSNRIISAFGTTMTLREWSLETGIKPTTITQRIDYLEWPVEKALSRIPIHHT